MGLGADTKWRDILFTCVIFMNFANLVIGQQPLKFLSNGYINLLENTPINSTIGNLTLIGGDYPKITSQNDYVNVSVTNQEKDSVKVNIILNIPVDYENDATRVFTCYFLGTRKSDNATVLHTVNVYVKDVNEPPVLQNKPYSVNVQENMTINSIVYTLINALDQDEYDILNYKIIPSVQTKDTGKFIIDPINGSLILVGPLDFENVTFYQYRVIVTDKAANNDSADVYITIMDVQDTPPYFTGEPFQANVLENVGNDTNVLTVKASDGDRGVPNDVLFSITKETCLGLFTIEPKSGLIKPNADLDREGLQNHGTCVLDIMATEDNQHPQAPGSNYTATTSVVITIEDINDNPPRFSQPSYNVTVEENTQPGIMINLDKHISVTDKDQGDNALFDVSIITYEDYFEVTPTKVQSTGEIWIRVKNSTLLDYEARHNLTIEIQANDTMENSHRTTATVTIYISNLNDNSPNFTDSTFYGSVFENSTSGASVLVISATDGDENENNHNYGVVTYTIGSSDSSFIINTTNGLIEVGNIKLDRERKDTYYLTVFAEDGGHSKASVPVEIKILDSNDNAPKFIANYYQTSLKEEGFDMLTPITVLAIDDDEPNTDNSKISYSITKIPPELLTNPFRINKNSGEITLSSAAPDYEYIVHYFPDGAFQIEVTATDWGIPPLNSSVLINVTILDVNDKEPRFDQPSYLGSVKENSATGISVAKVNATDDDGSSPNNDFYYVIQSGSQDKFQINTTTGEISVGAGANLDRETIDKFTLTVLVIDRGSPPLTGTTTVFIEILDVNDSPPEINPKSGVFTVNENAPAGLEIANFNATDKDEYPNLVFRLLWIDSSAYDEKERPANSSLIQEWLDINNITGVITVKSNMDREQIERMVLKVVVADKNASVGIQEATATVTVSLLDVNDNSPKITSSGSELQLNVSEGTKLGTEITTLAATDADKNQTIKFSLPDTNSSFMITDQGKLTLIKHLDREIKSHLSFDVFATDNGSPPLSSNITLIINVLDINDNDPYFLTNETTFSVQEDSDNKTFIAKLTARDDDAGDNGNVTFKFKEYCPFRIDPITGDIFVSEPIDREDKNSYTLTVIAADNPLWDTIRQTLKTITINIEDINDNAPIFKSQTDYEGNIPETASVGTVVVMMPGQISATDKDYGNNSRITFSLQDSDHNYFTIDQSSGEVRVNCNITDKPDIYRYVVNATDNGIPPLWTVTNLTIDITDENNHDPVLDKVGSIKPIPECAKSGQSVYNFSGTDGDKNKNTNGKVQFIFANTGNNDSRFFQLDRNTGELSTFSSNKEDPFASVELSDLTIKVQAVDCGNPSRYSRIVPVTITITDANDNAPKFDPAINTNFSVMEGLTNLEVGNVIATDDDKDSKLTYLLSDIDNSWADYFNIISSPNDGGVIYVKKPLDREEIDQIKLKIIVSDKADDATAQICGDSNLYATGHTAELLVNIIVEDSNDNPPIFREKQLVVGFLSSTKYGEKIISLLSYVKDKDTAPNSVHGFYQVGETEADSNILKTWSKLSQPYPIRVDVNGTVSTNYKFNEGAFGYFTLHIMANDSAGNDTAVLKVYVVGESQVIHLTLWRTEEEARLIQEELVEGLSDPNHQFVADNILPVYNKDGTPDNGKSFLVVHALDGEENIISGDLLLSYLDRSPQAAKMKNEYKIYSAQTGEEVGKAAEDKTDNRQTYILIGIIAAIAITFVITLYLLIHTIRRFKRKLKAATLEANGMDNLKQDIFPGLDNNLKSNNPIFMRNDLSLDETNFGNYDHSNKYDSLSSASENSLDQNELNFDKEKDKTGVDEQEVTLDVFENAETEPGLQNLYQHLHFKLSQILGENEHSTHVENDWRSKDMENEEDLDIGMSNSNFDSVDI